MDRVKCWIFFCWPRMKKSVQKRGKMLWTMFVGTDIMKAEHMRSYHQSPQTLREFRA